MPSRSIAAELHDICSGKYSHVTFVGAAHRNNILIPSLIFQENRKRIKTLHILLKMATGFIFQRIKLCESSVRLIYKTFISILFLMFPKIIFQDSRIALVATTGDHFFSIRQNNVLEIYQSLPHLFCVQ